MTLYKDNPNLKLKKVVTVSGNVEYMRNCRKIKKKYYLPGIDCFEVGGKWYSATSKFIIYDHEHKQYILAKEKDKLIYGVVGVKDGEVEFGYFTPNKYENIWAYVPNYGNVKAISEKLAIDMGYIESIPEGTWYDKKSLTSSQIQKFGKITGSKVYRDKGYNIEDNAKEFQQKIEAYEGYNPKMPLAAVRYGKLLGATTYGAEIETSMGYLPDVIQNRTGVVICRDGSIDNAEFVTVPMSGAKGLNNIKYLASELSKRTNTDIKCSLHFHLGNVPTDRLFIVALYALGIRIQDEIFKMFPYYKTEPQGIKKKNYNQKLRKLGTELLKPNCTKEEFTRYVDEAYYRMFTFLNDGVPPDDEFNRNNNRHVRAQKWERQGRYYWLNFLNFFFSTRRTAEFRLHQATLNGQKMILWLFICNAIVRYAEANAKEILSSSKPISLETVLNYYKDHFGTKDAKFLSEYLNAYVKNRKEYFLRDYKNGDYVSEQEQVDDKKFVFTYEGVGMLF